MHLHSVLVCAEQQEPARPKTVPRRSGLLWLHEWPNSASTRLRVLAVFNPKCPKLNFAVSYLSDANLLIYLKGYILNDIGNVS